MTRRDGRRSYDHPVPLPSAPDLSAPAEVVRLSPAARTARLVCAGVALVLLLAGTLWGQDDAFPFGPFKMYSGRADPNATVVSTRVVGLTAAGEEVRLSGGQVGLRRAEFEGQLPRISAHPELLGLLAHSYAVRHPDAEELVDVQVVERHFLLSNGQQTGAYDDRVIVEYDLAEDGQ
jgi:hypothetical protein